MKVEQEETLMLVLLLLELLVHPGYMVAVTAVEAVGELLTNLAVVVLAVLVGTVEFPVLVVAVAVWAKVVEQLVVSVEKVQEVR